jgi:Zn-dependent peptidase ImmA (M78 family)
MQKRKNVDNKDLIDINPQILIWAREESQAKNVDVVNILGFNEKEYSEWERTGKNIPFKKLQILSKYFRRQLSCFFLTEVPKRIKKPTDHRNLNIFNPNLSNETALVIRRANRYTKLLMELNDADYYKNKYKWLEEFKKSFSHHKTIDKEDIVEWVRTKINFSIETQRGAGSPGEVYSLLRNMIEEKLGISVFQFKMPKQEVQGFCYADDAPYCIIINSDHYAETGKIFTLMHELGHILKHQSSICYPEKVDNDEKLEFECNSFAGNLLIPKNVVMFENSAAGIYRQAKKLRISSEAYLRRMKTLGLVSDEMFFKLLDEIRSKVIKPRKGFAILSQIQKSVNSRGRHLFDTVVDASRNNKISYSSASDVLGIKINHFVNL